MGRQLNTSCLWLPALAACICLAASACGADGEDATSSADAATREASSDDYAAIVSDANLLPVVDEAFKTCSIVLDEFSGCETLIKTVEVRANRLVSALEAAQDPESADYLGTPPTDISVLVDDTHSHAKTAADTARAFSDADCVVFGGDDQCTELNARLSSTYLNLIRDLKGGWSPYQ